MSFSIKSCSSIFPWDHYWLCNVVWQSHSFLFYKSLSSFQVNSLLTGKTFIILWVRSLVAARSYGSKHLSRLQSACQWRLQLTQDPPRGRSRVCAHSNSRRADSHPRWLLAWGLSFLPHVLLRASARSMAAGFPQCKQVREKEGRGVDGSQSLLVTLSWKWYLSHTQGKGPHTGMYPRKWGSGSHPRSCLAHWVCTPKTASEKWSGRLTW